MCPKACGTASSHRYLPLGTFRQRAVRGGCIADYASYILSTLRGLVKCIVDRQGQIVAISLITKSHNGSCNYLLETPTEYSLFLDPRQMLRKVVFLEQFFGIALLYIDHQQAKSLGVLRAAANNSSGDVHGTYVKQT